MHCHVEHLRIVREVLVQDAEQVQQGILLLQESGAANAIQSDPLL